jgi:hypothetical protein
MTEIWVQIKSWNVWHKVRNTQTSGTFLAIGCQFRNGVIRTADIEAIEFENLSDKKLCSVCNGKFRKAKP